MLAIGGATVVLCLNFVLLSAFLFFASRANGRLVIEINTDDGTQVTHTYALEAQGKRMRVKTLVVGSKAPIPGGIPFERLFNRVDATPAVAP